MYGKTYQRHVAMNAPEALQKHRERVQLRLDYTRNAWGFAQRNYKRAYRPDSRLIEQYRADIMVYRDMMYQAMRKGDRFRIQQSRANLDMSLSAFKNHAGYTFLGKEQE